MYTDFRKEFSGQTEIQWFEEVGTHLNKKKAAKEIQTTLGEEEQVCLEDQDTETNLKVTSLLVTQRLFASADKFLRHALNISRDSKKKRSFDPIIWSFFSFLQRFFLCSQGLYFSKSGSDCQSLFSGYSESMEDYFTKEHFLYSFLWFPAFFLGERKNPG